MSLTGKARRAWVGSDFTDVDLEAPWPSEFYATSSIVNDAFWFGAFGPVEIPYAWISPVVVRRPTTAANKAVVTQEDGNTARASDATSIRRNGAGVVGVDISSAGSQDPTNLASFIVTYGATPQPRQPVLRINLYGLSETQALKVARVQLGQRIRITDAPTSWPDAAINFTVAGITHTIAVDQRLIDWTTAPLAGSSPDAPGPWVRADISTITGSDVFVY